MDSHNRKSLLPRPRKSWCLLLACLPLLFGADKDAAKESVSPQELARLWRGREGHFKDLVCEWVDHVTLARQDHILREVQLRERRLGGNPTQKDIEEVEKAIKKLPQHTVHDETQTLKFAGISWRLDTKGMHFNGRGDLLPVTETAVFSDTYLKSYIPEYKAGNISRSTALKIPGLIQSRTPFFLFRPVTFHLIDPSKLRLTLYQPKPS